MLKGLILNSLNVVKYKRVDYYKIGGKSFHLKITFVATDTSSSHFFSTHISISLRLHKNSALDPNHLRRGDFFLLKTRINKEKQKIDNFLGDRWGD